MRRVLCYSALLISLLSQASWAEETKTVETAAKPEAAEASKEAAAKPEAAPASAEAPAKSEAAPTEEAAQVPEAVRKSIEGLLAELAQGGPVPTPEIRPAPVAGLYEVVLESLILYASADGKYLIEGGDILDLQNERHNLTEARRGEMRMAQLKEIKPEDAVVFKAEGETKHVLTAFTDTDCFYCRKLHKEIPALNKAGVEVRYLAFPRAGINSPTYHNMVSIWCSEDRNKAMDDAKAGHNVEQKFCKNPVQDQYELGRRLGVTGTPALLMPDGELFPGYAPAADLVKHMESKAPVAASANN